MESWRQALSDISAEVDAWGEQMMQTLDEVGRGLQLTSGGAPAQPVTCFPG
ncbi:MAG: hypothetical protein ACUVXF_00555 [Desulfobaccales bacterium]